MKPLRIICALVGHRPRNKMSCVICDRCRYVMVNPFHMPIGVRVVHKDHSKHEAEVRYVGKEGTSYVWRIVSTGEPDDISSIEVDILPVDAKLILPISPEREK